MVPLSPDELMRAIVQPPARLGIGVEAALVSRLVAELANEPGALPLLQYTLGELFDKREQDNLTLASYEELDGIQGALSLRAEAVYESLSPEEQEAARALFSRLVTLGRGAEVTKRRALLEEMLSIDQSGARRVSQESMIKVIAAFGKARLLTFDHDPATRGSTVELAHEALLEAWPRLSFWLDLDRAIIRLERLLAQVTSDWRDSGEDERFLSREARLDQLAPLADSGLALTEDERRFLELSLAARDMRRAAEEARRNHELLVARSLAQVEADRAEEQALSASRLRTLAVGLTIALAVAGIAAVSAFFFARASERNAQVAATREVEALRSADLAATREVEAVGNARLATSREFSQAASALLQVDPELSLLLALAALDQAPTKQAEEALHQALQAARTVRAFPTNAEGHFGALLAVAPDGRRVATPGSEEVTIWDIDSGGVLQMLPLRAPTSEHYELHFNPRGDQLTLLSSSPSQTSVALQTWDLLSGETAAYVSLPLAVAETDHLTISPDGQMLATVSETGLAELWDVARSQPVVTLHDSGEALVDLAFTSDGEHLMVAGRSGLVEQWHVRLRCVWARPRWLGRIDASEGALLYGWVGSYRLARY